LAGIIIFPELIITVNWELQVVTVQDVRVGQTIMIVAYSVAFVDRGLPRLALTWVSTHTIPQNARFQSSPSTVG
jgi:hypothetical protein